MSHYYQLDMFEHKLSAETLNFEKIVLLEKSHHNLRKGLFRRYGEQENKINEMTVLMKKLLEILGTK